MLGIPVSLVYSYKITGRRITELSTDNNKELGRDNASYGVVQ
jgi:hypothetical protein